MNECPYCDLVDVSHYHCARCGEESSMIGHWMEREWNVDGKLISFRGFTCDVNNERGAEEDDD